MDKNSAIFFAYSLFLLSILSSLIVIFTNDESRGIAASIITLISAITCISINNICDIHSFTMIYGTGIFAFVMVLFSFFADNENRILYVILSINYFLYNIFLFVPKLWNLLIIMLLIFGWFPLMSSIVNFFDTKQGKKYIN